MASRPSATTQPGPPGTFQALSSNPQGDPGQPCRGFPPCARDLPSSAGAPRPSLGVQQPFSTALEASGGVSVAPSPSAGAPPFCPPAGLPSSGWGSLRFSKSPLGTSSEGPETGTWRSRQGPSVCHCFPPAKINMRGELDQWFQPLMHHWPSGDSGENYTPSVQKMVFT